MSRHWSFYIQRLNISDLKLDGIMQARVAINSEVVNEYAEEMKRGVEFAPIWAFFDEEVYWVADGFHRIAAATQAKLLSIDVYVKKGSARDAQLFAVGANAQHGLKRSNADKRRAVEILLADAKWKKWGDSKIGKMCSVSDRFVATVRKELSPNGSEMERMVERNGTEYPMNTANIGNAKTPTPCDTTPAPECASTPGCEADQNVDTGATPDIECKNPNVIQREEFSDRTLRQPSGAPGIDSDKDAWKKALVRQHWLSLTRGPLPINWNEALVIIVPEIPPPVGDLEELRECARKLNCGVLVTQGLRHLVVDSDSTMHPLHDENVKTVVSRKAKAPRALPEFAAYETVLEE